MDNKSISSLCQSASLHKVSLEAIELLSSWQEEYCNTKHIEDRDNWNLYYLKLAYEVAKRSPDAQTQCGAVLVNSDNEIVATGYNGFIRNIPNRVLPNLRPEKYPFMIHAEENVLLSCARQGKSTLNTTLYVTGHPCENCLQKLWQAGITTIVYGNHSINMLNDPERQHRLEILLWLMKITNDKFIIRHIDYPKVNK